MPGPIRAGLCCCLVALLSLSPISGQLRSAEGPYQAVKRVPLVVAPDGQQLEESAAAENATGEESAGEQSGPGESERRTRQVGASEELSFRQEKVAAEMNELEQRMFRLAESLKSMEPENSSRLMLGLKYARDELILHQMREAMEALSQLELAAAETQQLLLLEKLERLQQLLLSDDLDFQLQLERLRQIREIVRRLDLAIQEEKRLQQQSEQAADAEQALSQAESQLAELDRLIEQQQSHLGAAEQLAQPAERDGKASPAAPQSPPPTADDTDPAPAAAVEGKAATPVERLAQQQAGTRGATQALTEQLAAAERPRAPLEEAGAAMEQATRSLSAAAPQSSVPPMQTALAALEKQRDALADRAEGLRQTASQQELAALQSEQQQNRSMSADIAEMIRGLGASGTSAVASMAQASGGMQNAEGALGQGEPGTASPQQESATEQLRKAREQLAAEAEKLLDQLRAEVKLRVLEGLTLMLEKQQEIRQSTQRLAPGVANGSRHAVSAVLVLAEQEEKLGMIASNLIALVEETEFGIALPAALWVVRDGMEDVQAALADGQADQRVVAEERQIEADLAALLEAMKNLPTKNSNSAEGGRGGGAQEELRELNRLVAELKMIRILQVRINRNTNNVDQERQAEAARITTKLRRRLLELQALQEDVRDVTEELAIQRGDELR